MRDWHKLVSEHLGGLNLEAHERAEVIEELADHLEEAFAEFRRQGLSEEGAAQRCLGEFNDWYELGRKIQSARRKENVMSNRVTQLWLPGLVTLVLSMGLLALAQIYGPKPWIFSWGHPPIALFYIPWLFTLPLVGAVGAYLSHRAGGSRRVVFSSIVFPILPFVAATLVILPVSLLFDRVIAHNPAPMAVLLALLGWVFGPGVALLAGGLPAQLFLSRRLSSGRTVSS